jgi:acetate kinase
MLDAVLAINAGSSSIKFALYALENSGRELRELFRGNLDGIAAQACFRVIQAGDATQTDTSPQKLDVATHSEALQVILDWMDNQTEQWRIRAVGHRVVHGGSAYDRAVLVDQSVLDDLKAIIKLAPLHQPHALQALEVLMKQWPHTPHVACFDTMFHTSMPPWEKHFALPPNYAQQGIRRYGFHGLSYEYISSVLPFHLGETASGKIIIAHLGHGVSMCALQQRQSIATTMSFTPLDGLPMGKRSGALDPAVVLYLLQEGMSSEDISDLLHHQSGLLGMSGISDDMRTLLNSADPAAADAVDYFCYRICRELGSLTAALGGLDAVVFTGGIGEHAASVRARICDAAAWLGLAIDADANQTDALQINTTNSKVTVWVIPTNEELMLARHAAQFMAEESDRHEKA